MEERQAGAVKLGQAIRAEFPFFAVAPARGSAQHGPASAYLDSAATSQKPRCVIERMADFLSYENANIHRGAYRLSGEATDNYQKSRAAVARFLNAPSDECVVFTRGATDSLNLLAYALEPLLSEGDCILLTLLEHHSNIVPWQMLAKRRKLRVEFVDIDECGQLRLDDFERKLEAHAPKVVSLTRLSNALGSVVPVCEVCERARRIGSLVVVDAAQAVAHEALDVRRLGCDFLVFSGHKLYGPTGIGVLYGREELLNRLEPVQGGGGMIAAVAKEGATWAEAPQRFEAGTPPIAEAMGLAAAIEFVSHIGFEQISAHEDALLRGAFDRLSAENGVTLYGPATRGGPQRSIISFNLKGIHPHDFSTIADTFNVQLRAGHHCAMPLLKRLGVQSTARVSFGMYSAEEDVESLCAAVRYAQARFA